MKLLKFGDLGFSMYLFLQDSFERVRKVMNLLLGTCLLIVLQYTHPGISWTHSSFLFISSVSVFHNSPVPKPRGLFYTRVIWVKAVRGTTAKGEEAPFPEESWMFVCIIIISRKWVGSVLRRDAFVLMCTKVSSMFPQTNDACTDKAPLVRQT